MKQGSQLRRTRAKKGLTLKQASRKIPISFPYLSEIERGESIPSPEVLARLNDFYGISVRYDYNDVDYPRSCVSPEFIHARC